MLYVRKGYERKRERSFLFVFLFLLPQTLLRKRNHMICGSRGGGGRWMAQCFRLFFCVILPYIPIISLSRNESAGGSGLYSDRWTTCRFCTICYNGMQLTAMNFFWRYLSIKVSLDIISFKVLKLRSPPAAILDNGLHGRRRCWPMAPLWCFYNKKSVQCVKKF